eukprot:6174027-Pyramimonas_sp.AAC.1
MARTRRQMLARSSEDSSRSLLQCSGTAPESAKIGKERPQVPREGSKTASSESKSARRGCQECRQRLPVLKLAK